MRTSAFVVFAVMLATGVYADNSHKVCSLASNINQPSVREVFSAPNGDFSYSVYVRFRNEINGLCTTMPTTEQLDAGKAGEWLSRADTAGRMLSESVFAYLFLIEDTKGTNGRAVRLAFISYTFQSIMEPIRKRAYEAAQNRPNPR